MIYEPEIRCDLQLNVYSLSVTQLQAMVAKREDEISKAMRRCYEKHVTDSAVSTLLFILHKHLKDNPF